MMEQKKILNVRIKGICNKLKHQNEVYIIWMENKYTIFHWIKWMNGIFKILTQLNV